jgi:hypothetical protein
VQAAYSALFEATFDVAIDTLRENCKTVVVPVIWNIVSSVCSLIDEKLVTLDIVDRSRKQMLTKLNNRTRGLVPLCIHQGTRERKGLGIQSEWMTGQRCRTEEDSPGLRKRKKKRKTFVPVDPKRSQRKEDRARVSKRQIIRTTPMSIPMMRLLTLLKQ